MNRRSVALLALGITLALAGCTTLTAQDPQPQDRPVFVNLTNGVDTSQTFELWVGDGVPLHNVTVHRASGQRYNVTEGTAGIGGTSYSQSPTVRSVTFPEAATLYGRYTLEPGATRTWTMAEPYPETVFVVVIYDDDRVTSMKSVACSEVLHGFGVETTEYGASGAYGCF